MCLSSGLSNRYCLPTLWGSGIERLLLKSNKKKKKIGIISTYESVLESKNDVLAQDFTGSQSNCAICEAYVQPEMPETSSHCS